MQDRTRAPHLHRGDVGVRHGQLVSGIAGGGSLPGRRVQDARHRRRRGRHVAPLRQHMQPQQPLPGGVQIRQQLLLPARASDMMCRKMWRAVQQGVWRHVLVLRS
jgi:hypothetical protein